MLGESACLLMPASASAGLRQSHCAAATTGQPTLAAQQQPSRVLSDMLSKIFGWMVQKCSSGTGQGGSGSGGAPQTYTAEQMRSRTAAQLMEILKARGLPVRGKKEELVQRLLEAQDRAKRAADPA